MESLLLCALSFLFVIIGMYFSWSAKRVAEKHVATLAQLLEKAQNSLAARSLGERIEAEAQEKEHAVHLKMLQEAYEQEAKQKEDAVKAKEPILVTAEDGRVLNLNDYDVL